MPLSFKQAGSLFVAGPNIGIYASGNTFAISGSASGGGGGVTGLTSAGTGNRLIFSSLTNNNTVLVQKSLSAGTGIAIIDSGTGTLTFSSTSTASGTIISGTNAGTGVAIFSAASGSNLVFRRILSGSNIGVYLSGNDIVISGTSGAINGVTGITNLAGGSNVLSSVTSGVLISRTISGSNGIEAVESGSNILVRPVNITANRLYIAGTGGALTVDDEFQIDATFGTMAIGFTAPQNNTTSRLLLAGSASGAISHMRLTTSAAVYTGATAGDIWYNSTSGNSLFFNKSTSAPTPFIFKDNNYSLTGQPVSVTSTTAFRILEVNTGGTLFATRYLNTLGVFTTITSKTISNTAVETSVLSTGGTFLYGDNLLNRTSHGTNPHLVVGKKYRFNARGVISGTSGGTFYGKMLIGSSLIASSSTFNLNPSLNNNYFEIDTTFTIRDVGTSGVVIGGGKMLTDATSLVSGLTRPIVAISSLGGLTGVTVNTTADQFFDVTINFSTASTTNAVVITEATLEYLN
jgi:hypothetical protein